MTAREASVARDLIARARLDRAKPKKVLSAKEEAGRAALAALHEAEKRAKDRQRHKKLYPVRGVRSFVECPVHLLAVAVDEAGRLVSTCPACVREADEALGAFA
jgi:hypothetical protein